MKTNRQSLFRIIARSIAAFAGVTALTSLAAEGTGVITGRILNPATGEYVRNATVEVKETGQSAVSGDGGEYRLQAVPAGTATVSVAYPGHSAAPAVVAVTGGGTTTRDFDLVSVVGQSGEGIIILDKVTVSASVEGNAKAIQEQRSSMNVTNTVATDVFGDFPEGNVAEFLRYVPGVDLTSAWGEPRFAALGGLDPSYTSVTMDGLPMAAADANKASTARALSFEMASLGSFESIEVSKTLSADVDANAPAGTINLRSKRAFDRRDRVLDFTATLPMHDSVARSFGKSYGPYDDGKTAKLRPGGQLSYIDTFFDRRLGIALNVGRSDLYEETGRMTHNYNYTATAADTRPQVMNTIAFMAAPRIYERNSAALAADFRATPNLSFGINLNWFNSALWTPQRIFTFTTGTRTAVTGDGVTDITSATNSSIAFTSITGVNKLGKSVTVSPDFRWKLGNLALEGRFAVTSADSWYAPQDQGVFYNPGTMTLANTRFTAKRSSEMSPDWQINQISGADISNPLSWPTTGTFQIADGRSASQKFYTGKLDGTLPMTIAGIPVEWKAGYKYNYEGRAYDDLGDFSKYTYAGPANPSFWADKGSEFAFNDTYLGGKITSISGGRIFMPSAAALYRDFLANPSYYRPTTLTAANAYAGWVTNHTRYGEEINAGYMMATAKPRKDLSLRAGLRYEKTTNIALEPDSYTSEEMRAAGYAVNAGTGLATTVDGIYRQFMSRPWVERRSSYDNVFPSASFRYQLPWNTDLSGGFSTTIRRAPYSNLSGQYIVNDENLTVTTTNPNLKPEDARNFALRLAHYSKSLGMFSLSVFERHIKNMFITDTLTAQEFGNTNPRYENYTFTTTVNSADAQTMRSLELQFSQNLGFLSSHLRRFTLNGAYTRNYLRHRTVEGLMPEIINGGFNFTYWRINVFANGSRTGDRWNSIANGRVDKGRLYVSAGGNIRMTKNLLLSLSIRNLTDSPEFNRVETRPDRPSVVQLYQSTGTTYTFQLKANF